MSDVNHDFVQMETTPSVLLSKPVIVLFTHVLAPLLSLLSLGRIAWLGWSEFSGWVLTMVLALAVVPLACATVSLLLLLVRRARPQPIWAALSTILLSLVFCVGLLMGMDLIQATLPQWMVGDASILLAFSGMMIAGFSSLWRVGTIQLKIGKVTDVALTIFGCICVPAATFIFVTIVENLSTSATKFVLPIVFGIAVMFVLLLAVRLVGQVLSFIAKFKKNKFVAFAEDFVIMVILPFSGLALNSMIPFPADFQTPAFYAATALTALALLYPDRKSRNGMAAQWFSRWVFMAFTLYFFLVFVPFLPFAFPALLFFGAGTLILAPTLLLWSHVRILSRTAPAVFNEFGKARAIAIAALGFLVIPIIIGSVIELHRSDLKRVMAFALNSDYNVDAKLPIPAGRAAHVIQRAVDFNQGRDLPVISAWYIARVYDGLYLRDSVLQDLSDKLLGNDVKVSKQSFGMSSMFSFSSSGRSSRGRNRRGSPSNTARLAETSVQDTVLDDVVKYTVKLKVKTDLPQAEFKSTLDLPAGAWIAGMRLKIGEAWKPAAVIERKAAEWVYNKIVVVERRDPALLTLDTPTHGNLRIFPVEKEGREIEIDVVMPSACLDACILKIGEREITVSPDIVPSNATAVYANGVLVLNEAWKLAHADESVAIKGGSVWVVVDCSATSDTIKAEDIEAAIRLTEVELGSTTNFMLMAVNAETKTSEILLKNLRENLPDALLPRQTGLDAMGALCRIVRQSALRGDLARGAYPQIVFVGRKWEPAFEKVSNDAWRMVLDEAPGLMHFTIAAKDLAAYFTESSKGPATRFEIPGSTETPAIFAFKSEDEIQLAPLAGRSLVVFSNGKRPEAVLGELVTPNNAIWTDGASVWRMQFEMERNTSLDLRKDILKASRASGVLSKSGAYIVVENTAQEKMLKEKQAQALLGGKELDFDEPPISGDAPGILLILGCFGFLLLVGKIRAFGRRSDLLRR